MRNIFKFMLFVALGAMVFVSCEEDKFTEKDAMEALQTIDVSLTVEDGSSMGSTVEGATVKLVTDSTASGTEKTTGGSGSVVFSDVKVGGSMKVYVNKDNYTKALFTISTSANSYRTSQVAKTVKIYPLSGDNLATVKGQLTIETDLTNRKPEKLANQKVLVMNPNLESEVERAFYGTTDSEGKYSIQVPVNLDGRNDENIRVRVPSQIDTTQTLALYEEDTAKVTTKPTVYYSQNYEESNIPHIPSAYASIEAPQAEAGSGFELGVEAEPSDFNDPVNNDVEVVRGGSGYHVANNDLGDAGDTTLTISKGINGNSTKVRLVINKQIGSVDSSSITSININSDAADYKSAPFTASDVSNLVADSLGGSDAIFDIRWENRYKVYIESYGSGYNDVPTVSANYKEYDGSIVDEEILAKEDLDLNISNELGGNDFNTYIDEHNGKLYPSSSADEKDTLFITDGLTEAPELSISSTSAGEQAIIYVNNINDSTITDVNIDDRGAGYDPANPPQVTVTSLAGYGSGAELSAEVNSNGEIDAIHLKDGGEGYVWNVNDPENEDDFYGQSWILWHEFEAGEVYIRNFDYGTGDREEE